MCEIPNTSFWCVIVIYELLNDVESAVVASNFSSDGHECEEEAVSGYQSLRLLHFKI